MLSAADMALFQQTAGTTRITSCVIQRTTLASDGSGGFTNSWDTLATVNGRIYPAMQTVQEIVAEGRIGEVVRWMIALPPGQDVTEKDRIAANGVTYEVIAVLAPRTYEIERTCQCEVIG